MTMKLAPQLKNTHVIKDMLKKVNVSIFLSDGRRVETLLVYLPSINGVINHTAFFDMIANELLHHFALTCQDIEKKLKRNGAQAADILFKKALSKLSQQTAHGELGELILFTLVDVYLEAPKLLSKISLKTSPQMPVFGADGVHIQYVNNKIRVYLGESKLYTTFSNAATKAASSIEKAKSRYLDEFNLIDSYIDLPQLDEDAKEELLGILNPFENKNIDDHIHSPCFIGFADKNLIESCLKGEDFLQCYINMAFNHIDDYYKKLEKRSVNIESSTLMILPFTDTEALVKDFITHLGIQK
ncbi:DUF1837 domain-containing protein [Enterobacter hormaechei]